MRIKLGFILCCLAWGAHAQPVAWHAAPDPLPKPAIANELHFPGGDSAFMRVWQKMDTLIFKGQGNVNWVHIGGSHVQAGLLTDVIRYRLQAIAPGLDGERGFFFPYRAARTNNPFSYKVITTGEWTGQRCSVPSHEGPWGVSGLRGWTTDSTATVRVYGRDEPLQFRQLRVFAAPDSSSMRVDFAKASPQPDTVWYSPDIQAYEAQWHELQDTIYFGLASDTSTQSYFSLEGLQVLRDDMGIRYHAIGANGAATHSYLKCERFVDQLQAFPPDVVIWGLGINDAYKRPGHFDTIEYVAHYDSLVAWVKQVNPEATFIWVTNNDSRYKGSYNPHGELVRRAMYRLAAKHGGAVHDFYTMMGGKQSMNYWIRKGWGNRDGIHMLRPGYAIQAIWLAEAIQEEYLKHFRHE